MRLPCSCLLLAIGAAGSLAACAPPQGTQILDSRTDRSGYGMGLDARDFSGAAQAAVNKLLASGAVDHPGGGRYVIAISSVTNDTMQRLDTDELIKKIRIALLDSGKAVITTAVGDNGPEDAMSMRTRELRNSEEFSQANVAHKHTLVAPELSLSGKFLQNNNQVDNGQRVDYAFQLTLTDLKTGLGVLGRRRADLQARDQRDGCVVKLIPGVVVLFSVWAPPLLATAEPVEPPLVAAGVGMSDMRPVEVDSEGTGVTADAAVAKALANAVAEQTGNAGRRA